MFAVDRIAPQIAARPGKDALFALPADKRARLLASPLAELAPDERVADLFCGAGGWGEGARALGIRTDFAVNHDPVAIAAHEANNPGCKHHRGDAWRTKPRDVVGKGTKIGLLMASAACTTHSRARGSAPISKRVHMLGWCISRWMADVQPRIVLIENVPEWEDWGPTIVREDGLRVQDPARKGQHFRRWWRYCERLGYRMEKWVLDAPDYGAASRRRRLFIVARRDGQPICCPEKTHGASESGNDRPDLAGRKIRGTTQHRQRADKNGRREHQRDDARRSVPSSIEPRSPSQYAVRSIAVAPHRTAAECIDWSNLGRSIFERERPLADKTLARICEGIRRYVLNDLSPFILRVSQPHAPGGGWHVYPVTGALPTQTVRQDIAIGVPVISPAGGPKRNAQSVADLLQTVLVREDRGLVLPVLMNNTTHHTGGRVDGTMPTTTTGGQTGLVSPVMVTTGYGEREGQSPRVNSVADLLGTSVNGVKQAVVAPVMAYMNHGDKQVARVDEPGRTVVSGGNHAVLVAALMMEYYGNNDKCRKASDLLGAVTTLDRHGLVSCVIDGVTWTVVDILFRMLNPDELARAMGFREDFAWPKTKRETVRLIGNAVSPPQATALIRAVLPRHAQGPIAERRAAS